jgi:hypothetical protein
VSRGASPSRRAGNSLRPLLQSSFEVTSHRLPGLSQLEPFLPPQCDQAGLQEAHRLRALKSEYTCHSHILLSHELLAELRG